jgi:tRNA (guanine37-N1)-methyltransferase
MTIDVVTLFPEMIEETVRHGILGKAIANGILCVRTHQLRDYCGGSIHAVDDAPYGGGPGMVMRPEPIFAAVEDITARYGAGYRILLTPQGARLEQSIVQRLAQREALLLMCGRYEGFDERVRGLFDEELSIGDYVLTGGELAASVVVEAVGRLLPGVLGCAASAESESFSSGLLEYPQYTRPENFRGMRVPAVLTSGNHAQIERWRHQQAIARTEAKRPDLLSPKRRNEQE